MGSSDNVLLGGSLSLKLKKQTLYSQFIVDEFSLTELKNINGSWFNKYGAQAGIKGLFSFLKEKFVYRIECNAVRPYTYSHISPMQTYGNRGTTLSHPFGGNFIELLGELKWQKNNWFSKIFINYGLQGFDKNGKSYGGNIYLPYTLRPSDINNEIGQGVQNNFFKLNMHIAHKLSEKGSIFAFAELQYRYDTAFSQKSLFIPFIGIRSYLWNDYRNY
jgi:hypothetical protein